MKEKYETRKKLHTSYAALISLNFSVAPGCLLTSGWYLSKITCRKSDLQVIGTVVFVHYNIHASLHNISY